MRSKARNSQLSVFEFISPLHSLAGFQETARDAYISYLKSSGERITDLLTMSNEDLRKWYGIVKKQNDAEHEAIRKRSMELEKQQRRPR